MKKYPVAVAITLSLVSIAFLVESWAVDSREGREVQMAEQAILSSLVLRRSAAGSHLCSGNALGCLGPDKAELGLALIGARRTAISDAGLARLLRFEMDGALSEDYTCYILNNGSRMKSRLANVNAVNLNRQCESDFNHLIAGNDDLKDFQAASVCRNVKDIQVKVQELLKGIRSGQKCGSEDF